MGFWDMLSDAVINGSNDIDPGTMGLSKGLFGGLTKDMDKATEKKKPGQFCNPACMLEESFCAECLQKQQIVANELEELRNLERSVEQAQAGPAMAAPKKITRCPSCSAPFEKGASECPYCMTPYPDDTPYNGIPTGRSDRQTVLLQKAETTYAAYTEMKDYMSEKSLERMKQKTPGFLKGALDSFGGMLSKLTKMNAAQLKQGAEKYGVSYSEYILGIDAGRYQTVGGMQLDEQNRRMEAERARQNELYERNRQIRMEAEEKKRQIAVEKTRIMTGMTSKPTDWTRVNATERCDLCQYYDESMHYCTERRISAYPDSSCPTFKRV